jgi:Glycosyl hydrolase family 12
MKQLPLVGRLLPVFALVAVAVGFGSAPAEAAGTARTCAHPRFVTSGWEGQAFGKYYADSDMWNASNYSVSQHMRVCAPGNWSVVATANNDSGDGAVKTYPNVHRDYHNWTTGHEPKLSALRTLRTSFASRSPHVGIYDGAYDIWMNGVADSNSTEVMIWTDNFHQFPSGSVVKRGLHFSHRTWKVYATGDHSYIAYVPNKPLPHGTIALKQRLGYLEIHGYLPKGSTVGQVGFGYEIVSTGGSAQRFKIDRFSVTSTK